MLPMFRSNRTAARKTLKTKQNTPLFINTRRKIQSWPNPGAGAYLLSAIRVGIRSILTALPTAHSRRCPRAPPSLNGAIAEYLALGVLRMMSQQKAQTTRHWSPVFGRRKADSGKLRVITDLRQQKSAWSTTPQIQNRKLVNHRRMPVPEAPADVGSDGGRIEPLIPPRAAPQRG